MEPLTFEAAKKSFLVNSKGIKYAQFKASLKPKYYLIWLQIALGYGILAATVVLISWLQNNYPGYSWLFILPGAVNIGYWFAFTHLFIHEASHYNIAADKKRNDILANIFLGSIAGTHIGFYRIVHFDHHRYLGTTKDTEHTYFEPLNWKFIVESLTGIRVLKVLRERDKAVAAKNIDPDIMKKNNMMSRVGMLLNFIIIAALFASGYWQAAVAWIGGIGIMFPFFLSLRQLLEHRQDYAQASIDYTQVDQGEISRMFGTGPVASTLGSAGFNRHFLHHWDPQISCTRLKDVEVFLQDTELASEVQSKGTNYFTTFIKLFNK